MSLTISEILWYGVWFTVGNWVFQALATRDWSVAADRTFFQLILLGWLCLVAWLMQRGESP